MMAQTKDYVMQLSDLIDAIARTSNELRGCLPNPDEPPQPMHRLEELVYQAIDVAVSLRDAAGIRR